MCKTDVFQVLCRHYTKNTVNILYCLYRLLLNIFCTAPLILSNSLITVHNFTNFHKCEKKKMSVVFNIFL